MSAGWATGRWRRSCRPAHILIAGPPGAGAPAVTHPERSAAGDTGDGSGAGTSDAADGDEGFTINAEPGRIVIAGRTGRGCLHGVFAFLRGLQAGRIAGTEGLQVSDAPACPLRIIDHWDNLDGEDRIDPVRFASVRARLELQRANAAEWRDVVNSYFFRKSGIADERGRRIY